MSDARLRVDSIETTGKLREYLAKAIVDVKRGALDVDRANTMVKAARSITESMYSEVKVKSMAVELGAKPQAEIGDLKLGEPV